MLEDGGRKKDPCAAIKRLSFSSLLYKYEHNANNLQANMQEEKERKSHFVDIEAADKREKGLSSLGLIILSFINVLAFSPPCDFLSLFVFIVSFLIFSYHIVTQIMDIFSRRILLDTRAFHSS